MTAPSCRRLLMPLPASLEVGQGEPLPSGPLAVRFSHARSSRMERAVARLPGVDARGEPVPLEVDCAQAGDPHPALGDREDYSLTVTSRGIRLEAAEEWGVLRGLATLTQLFGSAQPLPPLRIDDAPRFPWRGVMLDVARHFMPLQALQRTLDAMAVFKLNVLHLHLSDDQGFRFPSRCYPRLPSPEHYSPDELATLVAAAAERGIRVVPELDVPGHAASWLAAYPDWGNRKAQPSRRFGVHRECLDPTRPAVLEAVQRLFAEVAEVFPDAHLHIGGDEVHPGWWSEDPRVQAFMRAEGLDDAADLQAWFNLRTTAALRGLGRRPVGWDEVLHPALTEPMVVQAWRGATARDRALAAGHDCVVSAPYYLDLFYPADVHYRFDPAAPQSELVAQEDDLLRDPRFAHVADGMAWTRQWREHALEGLPEGAGRVLGGEGCLWAELVDARVLDVRLWSRMPALAERFWSPAACHDADDMYQRLDSVLDALPAWVGIDVRGDYRRLTAEAGLSDAWRPLADVLEPVKWYGRLLGEEALAARLRGREMPKARPYDADSPLDRVVDGLPPESLPTRDLDRLVRAEAAGDAVAAARLRELARLWRALPARGGPAELEPAAERLRQVGELIDAVLDDAVVGGEALKALEEAAQPVGEYLLAPVPVLAAWVEQRSRRP